MTEAIVGPRHPELCLRLMQSFRRVAKGFSRWQDCTAPAEPVPLNPRHVAALEYILGGPLTVGDLASRLDLTLATVSGTLADLDRAGLIERYPDPADRRRTIVCVSPAQASQVAGWLDGVAAPLARVLDALTPPEQVVFVKAMELLETELQNGTATA